MKCPFNCGNKDENTNFDKPTEHLVILMNATGHIHVHGPFKNEFAIRKFAEALIAEM